ncbi:hypothetical protein PF001_g17517 [Phytophthora fragariae]|uniref:Uncharacterized protein n=1 Tax=Phytophthora fragariae TaxID=53985 RepID=A0A6A4CTY9_9STRA|nr:hypothetical protein PF001_g17517 [Phytophthora fragariae]
MKQPAAVEKKPAVMTKKPAGGKKPYPQKHRSMQQRSPAKKTHAPLPKKRKKQLLQKTAASKQRQDEASKSQRAGKEAK